MDGGDEAAVEPGVRVARGLQDYGLLPEADRSHRYLRATVSSLASMPPAPGALGSLWCADE